MSSRADMLFMYYAVTLTKTIVLTVGRKKFTCVRIFRSGEVVIGIIFKVSIGCLEEYSMSPI